MNNIKAILFDNDGVLAHTERYWFEADRQTLWKVGVVYSEQDFIDSNFVKGQGTRGWLAQQGFNATEVQQIIAQRDSLWQQLISGVDVTDPDAVPLMKKLSSNYQLGVVTNTDFQMFGHLHGDSGFSELFDILILRDDYKNPKPAPDAYLAALEKLKLPASSVLVIEDSPRGIQSAKQAGLKVASISNPEFKGRDLSGADYHIQNLQLLPPLLGTLQQ
ncbi:MAG: HAD family phosphatase [Proteobacteria bacterium]|nr:HAD family phosphatase [Pseudomonadota bacterium]